MIGALDYKIATLREGDTIELRDGHDTTVRGTLVRFGSEGRGLTLGGENSTMVVRRTDGLLAGAWADWSIDVISHAPLPLYRNHARTSPRCGDVVRLDTDLQDWADSVTWFYNGTDWRQLGNGTAAPILGMMPLGLTLLVDGETGQVVR